MKKLLVIVLLLTGMVAVAQVSTNNEKLFLITNVMGAASPNLPISTDGLGTDDKLHLQGVYPGITPGAPPAVDAMVGIPPDRRLFMIVWRMSMVSAMLAGNILLWFLLVVAIKRILEWNKRTPSQWDREQHRFYEKINFSEEK